jgi:peptidoglycan/xylan/chitin deacetylase (PgdA/CDA1 family)
LAPTGFVLTFHSRNISGNDYATNDHVALDGSIALLRRLKIPVLRLVDAVNRSRNGSFAALPSRFACITFDDGPDYDWRDIDHPTHGPQASAYSILRSHSRRIAGPWWWRRACGTTFVIASPVARSEIADPPDVDPDRLSDSWWASAQASGLLDIGNHGWNHVHPGASEMRSRPDLVERFDRIASFDDADLQVRTAYEYIRKKAGPEAGRLFAYPYGQVSEYMANEYLPAQDDIVAAFTTEPRPWTGDCDRWRVPRYVCGWHWKTPGDLEQLLTGPAS